MRKDRQNHVMMLDAGERMKKKKKYLQYAYLGIKDKADTTLNSHKYEKD